MKDSKLFSFNAEMTLALTVRDAGREDSPVALLLHGYALEGADILNSLESSLPTDWLLLAPNAPYPFYSSKQKKMVYSWYFYDSTRDIYVVDMSVTLKMLGDLMRPYQQAGRPIYIVGYSQGGYLAPFVALSGVTPEKIIVINGRLRHEDLLKSSKKFPVLSLHGDQDTMVEVQNCVESIKHLQHAGWDIDLHLVKGSEHELDSALREELKRSL